LTSKVWEKEGAYIAQSTTQIIDNVYDYDSREAGKVMNVDNKLAMIVDDLETIVNLTAKATSVSSDSQASSGNITNNVYGNITTVDP
jgi:predicted PurR-regulated permease PerM